MLLGVVDKCLKWRVIPYHKNYLYKDFPDSWQCSDSLDPSSNSCAKQEQLPKIDSAALKHKSQLKQPEPAPKRETQKNNMSAARQEQIKLEEVLLIAILFIDSRVFFTLSHQYSSGSV